MKKILSIILSLCFVISTFAMSSTVSAEDYYSSSPVEHCGVHDPSIMKAKDGRYYIVGSHLVMGESDDLVNWHNNEFDINASNYFADWKKDLAEPLEWCSSYQRRTHEIDPTRYNSDDDDPNNDFEYNCWANDIIYNDAMGKYCLYGSCSVWGTTASVIWLATSDNIKGPYHYEKSFIYSGITYNNVNTKDVYGNFIYNGLYYEDTNIPADLINAGYMKKTDIYSQPWFGYDKNTKFSWYSCGWNEFPNCIDPTAFFDANGEMWIVYGSYSGGCFVIKLDKNTGTPDYAYMNSKKSEGYDIYYGKRVSTTNADTEGTGEGPFIIYDPQTEYYYFFLTYGGLGGNGGYNIREYRSKNPDGPYVDAAGFDARDEKNTGLKLIGNYKLASNNCAYLSPGHSSCLIDDDSSMYQAYHTRFTQDNGWGFQTRIHKMARTTDGWAIVLPFEYQGEDITSVTADDVVGQYEFVDMTNQHNRFGDDSVFDDIVMPTQVVTFNADGTITGAKKYKFDITHSNLGSESVEGTWSLSPNGIDAAFTIGGLEYNGVFTTQKDESANSTDTVVFTAKGDDNSTIWGAKHENLECISVVSSNCYEAIKRTYSCTHCDNKIVEIVGKPKGHSKITVKENVVPSTCTKKGTYDEVVKCFECGREFSREQKTSPLAQHKSVSANNAVSATCGRNGKRSDTICSVCKKTLTVGTVVNATGKHTYDTGKVTTAPTSSKAGVMTYTCKTCKHKKTSSIPKLAAVSISTISPIKKGFKLTWKKVSSSTGYQIRYSTKSSMASPKTVLVTKNSTVSKSISNLTSKKKYFVQIRTYKTINGTKYYSSWSKTKSVTTK